ncbi:uncharacterized protein METZ01_LOCUS327107 [marine metagenome]|uniref:Uncharacterized protein n=1 Tax=marine metagenome TaxID=408172 RepID=A0A382PLK1_9ZZZZ
MHKKTTQLMKSAPNVYYEQIHGRDKKL